MAGVALSLRKAGVIAAAALVCATATLAYAVTDDERVEAHREFRTLFEATQFAEALPVAQRVVAMTEEQYGGESRALVNPLTNLGTTQLRLRNYAEAEVAYQRAIRILESRSGVTDRLLLRPVQGLGMTYMGAQQTAPATDALKRALDLSRNLDGLYNAGQLPIVLPLIEAYVAENRHIDAEREHQYAFRVAEQAYGAGDLRMLEPLDVYARWYEFVGRYTTARIYHGRALGIAERKGVEESVAAVPALRGIARTYRLEFVYGPEVEQQFTTATFGGMPTPDTSGKVGLNPDGERALKIALQTIGRAEPVDSQLRGETLVQLGDWYLTAEELRDAREAYREAYAALLAASNTQLLAVPRQLAYRPPQASISRFKGGDVEDFEEKLVEVAFTVRKDGEVVDARVTNSDAPEGVQRQVVSSARKSLYAPRIVDGEMVDTPDVTLRERVLVKRPK